MRKLTPSQEKGIRKRVRYLIEKQASRCRPEVMSRTGTLKPGVYGNQPYTMFFFLGHHIQVSRSSGFEHVGDILREMFSALGEYRVSGELLAGIQVLEGGSPEPLPGPGG